MVRRARSQHDDEHAVTTRLFATDVRPGDLIRIPPGPPRVVMAVHVGPRSTTLIVRPSDRRQGTRLFCQRGMRVVVESLAPDPERWVHVLLDAGVRTQEQATALGIDERDKILSIAAWDGDADTAWNATLRTLRSLETESESES